MDAAVLLEAGWTDMVHEVWVTLLPEEEVRQNLPAHWSIYTCTHPNHLTKLASEGCLSFVLLLNVLFRGGFTVKV